MILGSSEILINFAFLLCWVYLYILERRKQYSQIKGKEKNPKCFWLFCACTKKQRNKAIIEGIVRNRNGLVLNEVETQLLSNFYIIIKTNKSLFRVEKIQAYH